MIEQYPERLLLKFARLVLISATLNCVQNCGTAFHDACSDAAHCDLLEPTFFVIQLLTNSSLMTRNCTLKLCN
jgi:hypothetical protein